MYDIICLITPEREVLMDAERPFLRLILPYKGRFGMKPIIYIMQTLFNEELKYPNLKKKVRNKGWTAKEDTWSLNNIKDGLEYFYDLHGHYPTSKEIDVFEFLPSSRQMQRAFGGLVRVRKQINLKGPKDYTREKVRSKVGIEADKRTKIYEEEFYNFLVSKVDELRVHEHKIIRPGYVSSDFFIYTSRKKAW